MLLLRHFRLLKILRFLSVYAYVVLDRNFSSSVGLFYRFGYHIS